MLWKYWTVLRSGQWKLYKNRVTREWNMYNTACDWIIELNENRIVQAFNDIVDVLIEQVNFNQNFVSKTYSLHQSA